MKHIDNDCSRSPSPTHSSDARATPSPTHAHSVVVSSVSTPTVYLRAQSVCVAMPADSELSNILNRRQAINEALDEGKEVQPQFRNVHKSIYAEFHEFTRRQIKDYEHTFNKSVFFLRSLPVWKI